jgi:hypothetical protein
MPQKLSPEIQRKAFDNWLNGMSDEENATDLDISDSTIERWRVDFGWLDVANKIRLLARQEYEYQRARELANRRIAIDERHKKAMEMLTGKVLMALKNEEEDLTSAQKLHNYSVANSTLLQIFRMEREIFGITNSSDGDDKNKSKIITFQLLDKNGGMPDADQLEKELEGQDPYAVPELHEMNQRGNILKIGETQPAQPMPGGWQQ